MHQEYNWFRSQERHMSTSSIHVLKSSCPLLISWHRPKLTNASSSSSSSSSTYLQTLLLLFYLSADMLVVCCGQAGVRGKHVYVNLPSEAALADYHQLNNFPPASAAKFALKMLSILFSEEELSISNCTKAEGRKLLNQEKLMAIKCKPVLQKIYIFPNSSIIFHL